MEPHIRIIKYEQRDNEFGPSVPGPEQGDRA